jgi:hypothetical protein
MYDITATIAAETAMAVACDRVRLLSTMDALSSTGRHAGWHGDDRTVIARYDLGIDLCY